MASLTPGQKRLQGLARYLTGSDLYVMAKQYQKGECPRHPSKGYSLHRSEFQFVCDYLKTTPEKVAGLVGVV